jgi:hypothetical protein
MQILISGLIAKSADNAARVILIWVLSACTGIATAVWALSMQATGNQFTFGPTPAVSQLAKFDDEFPNLDNTITLKIVGKSPSAVAEARANILKTVRGKPDIFMQALSPGEGSYYDTFGVLYQSKSDVERRVAYVSGLRPLLDGLAQSRTLSGLATLTANVAKAAENGQNAQVFADLYNEIARTIQSQFANQPAPVDWNAIAGLDFKTSTKVMYVVAWPAPGMNPKALDILADIQRQEFAGARLTVVTMPSLSTSKLAATDMHKLAAAGAITVIFAALLVFVLSGSAPLAGAVTAAWVVVIAVWFLILSYGSPLSTTGVPALVTAALFAMLTLAYAVYARALAGLIRQRNTSLAADPSGNDASRRIQVPTVFLAGFLGVFFYPELRLQPLFLICAILFLITAIATVTLVPAICKMLMTPGAMQQLGHSRRRTVRKSLILVVALVSVLAQISVLPNILRREAEPIQIQPTVSILAQSRAAALSRVEQLKSIPEVKGTRWIGGFVPPDAADKIALFKALEPSLPKPEPSPTPSPTAIELQVEARKIEKSLADVAATAGVNEPMRKAVLAARRSLSLLLDTGPPDGLRTLERNLFFGMDKLEQELTRLSKLALPGEKNLDAPLRRLFLSPGGTYRIEVEPADGTSANGLAYVLASKGIVAVSTALVQREGQGQIDRIMYVLIGVATLASFLLLVLARSNVAAALRQALVVLAVTMIEVVLLIVSSGRFQQHHVVWALVIFATLWGQAAFTPASEVFRLRANPRQSGPDFLVWFAPLVAFGLAASLWLVGAAPSAALACVAATVLLLSACFQALIAPSN